MKGRSDNLPCIATTRTLRTQYASSDAHQPRLPSVNNYLLLLRHLQPSLPHFTPTQLPPRPNGRPVPFPTSRSARRAGRVRLIAPLLSRYLHLLKCIESCEVGVASKLKRSVIAHIESTYTMARKLLTRGAMRRKLLTTNLSELLAKVGEDDYEDLMMVIEKVEACMKHVKVQELQELGMRIGWRKGMLRGLIEEDKDRVYEDAVGDVMGFAKPLPLAKIKKYKAIEDSLREGQQKFGYFSEAFKSKQMFFNNLNDIEMNLALN